MKKLFFGRFNLTRISLILLIIMAFVQCGPSEKEIEQKKIQEIISSMSLEQKAQLVIGTGMSFTIPEGTDPSELGPLADMMRAPEGFDSLYLAMVENIRKNCPGAAGNSVEFPSLGITSQTLSDGPAGLRISPTRNGEEGTFYCTAFPIATVLASSWDTKLVEEVGKAMGNEVLEYNSDVLLAPGMNIQRDPLCGRNFEYYSEDPFVTGKMAAAMVKGVQSNGVGTSIKHFAANNQETNRLSVNTIVSQRALRELYLRGFEIAVKDAQPWTVMSSYNKVNGIYTSENPDLITKILRDDWGFEGYVMTDWGGGSDAVAQMKAGNDMIQPGNNQVFEIIEAVKNGTLDEEVLNTNIARILHIMFKTPKYKGYQASNTPDLKAHAQVTRQAATEGMVLLKNNNQALPISSDITNVAVFGTTSYEFISGGTGSGDVNEAYTVSLIEGLKTNGLVPDEELAKIYNEYYKLERSKPQEELDFFAAMAGNVLPVKEMEVSSALANKMAESSQVALITIGRNSGEGGDRKPVEGDFYLTSVEKSLIKNVSEAFQSKGKKVIVILNIGGVIETAEWREFPDAILCAWQPGQEAGNSVVDVIKGINNPSGKLAITFPVRYEDAPTAKNFPGHSVVSDNVDNTADQSGFSFMGRVPWEVTYEEDIYVGYRYYNTFEIPVAYEFGYGLSYTTFDYSNLKLSSSEFSNEITVTIDVKNAGNVAGKEVVQIYLSAPAEKLDKPAMVLVDFGKTKTLAPDETETLSFVIESRDLCSFDETTSSWIAEAGSYEIMVGASSRNIKDKAGFTLAEEKVVETVSNAMAPEIEINKLFTTN